MTTPDPLPDAWHKVLAQLAAVQAERDALRAELEEAQLELAAFGFDPAGALNAEWAPEPSRTRNSWGRGAANPNFGAAVIPGQMRYGKIVCEWRIYRKGDIDRTGGCATPRQAMRAAEAELRKRGLLDFPIRDTVCGRWCVSTAVPDPHAAAILGRYAQTGVWAEPDTIGVEVDLVPHTGPDFDAIRAMHAHIVGIVTGLCDMGIDTRESIREALTDVQSPVPHAR